MPCRPRPEAEEEPQRCDTAQRLQTIERWLQHAEEELLYTPDAQGEAAATLLDAPPLLSLLGRRRPGGSGHSALPHGRPAPGGAEAVWGVCRGGVFSPHGIFVISMSRPQRSTRGITSQQE
jgi:hypothetical protein